jgi:poly [ADP-ribose] polymerase
MKDKVLLIKVEPGENNNKFYQMEDLWNWNFKSSWGRVWTEGQSKIYTLNEWESKRREKERKWYSDISWIASTEKRTELKKLSNDKIQGFIDTLLSYSKRAISDQYLVWTNSITQKQLDKANDLLLTLQKSIKLWNNISDFNDNLLELYRTIPRKMKNVKENLFKSQHSTFLEWKGHISFATKLIDWEVELLNTLKTQIRTDIVTSSDQTILDILWIELFEIDNSEENLIKDLMWDNKHKFVKRFKVMNKNTFERYESFRNNMFLSNNEGLYWHGSRNENWLSIMENWLKIKPAGVIHTGSMFWNWIYFAPLFKKSLWYTSLSGSYRSRWNDNRGYLSIFRVNKWKIFEVRNHSSEYYGFDYNKCKWKGCDCLYAYAWQSLYNDELIVYNEWQCDIQYIVEVK